MRKLNRKKIRWIVKEVKGRELSVYRIAKQQEISKQHLWRVFHRFKDDIRPRLLPCGRKPVPVSTEEIEIVKKTHEEHGSGAVGIEKILSERGILISHNRIHRILKEQGLAKDQPAKKNRRKWVRYERRHSNSLWHTDWFEYRNRQYILYEDDASRLITGYGEFRNATTENSIHVFDSATEKWGFPKQVMSDHGAQFCANEERVYQFEEHLRSKGVVHIKARVKHPQSNGKLERLVLTMKKLMSWKGSLDDSVKFYNEKRPHMSLENGHLRTPIQAYNEKLRGES